MTFSTKQLVGSRTLVTGNDNFGNSGSVVLDSSQWESVKAHDEAHQAEDLFNSSVEEFFAPLTAAAEILEAAAQGKAEDPISYIVLHEAVEGVAPRPSDTLRLTKASQILRLLELNGGDRLVWVNDDLEILEDVGSYTVPTPATPPTPEVVVTDPTGQATIASTEPGTGDQG